MTSDYGETYFVGEMECSGRPDIHRKLIADHLPYI